MFHLSLFLAPQRYANFFIGGLFAYGIFTSDETDKTAFRCFLIGYLCIFVRKYVRYAFQIIIRSQ